MDIFASRFRSLIEESGKLQKDICNELGLSPSRFSNWKSGYAEPYYNELVLLADYFNVSTDYLLGRTDESDDVRIRTNVIEQPKDQKELNILYQSLAPVYRAQVLEYVRYMAERSGVNVPASKKRG